MRAYYEEDGIQIFHGDCREVLPQLEAESVNCCVTSPPYYGLRNYGNDKQIGLEKTHIEYVAKIVSVFNAVHRVLRSDGTAWLNIGDSYASGKGTCFNPGGNTSSFNVHLKEANVHPLDRGNKSTLAEVGLKPKDLIGIPWEVAFALRSSGWWLRSEVIWRKVSPMPESVLDRPTRAHESVFLLTKEQNYFYNWQEARDPLKASSVARLGQDVDSQEGSLRANGGTKTNGNMKAARFGGSRKSQINDQTRLASGNEWRQDPADGANWRDVWDISHEGFGGAHFATMPSELASRCIKAGTKLRDVVLDPFAGVGTTLAVAKEKFCRAIGIEIEEKYCEIAAKRLAQKVVEF